MYTSASALGTTATSPLTTVTASVRLAAQVYEATADVKQRLPYEPDVERGHMTIVCVVDHVDGGGGGAYDRPPEASCNRDEVCVHDQTGGAGEQPCVASRTRARGCEGRVRCPRTASTLPSTQSVCVPRDLFSCFPSTILIKYHSLSAQPVSGVCGGSAADTTPGLRSGRHWGALCGTVHRFRPSRPGCRLTQPSGKLRMYRMYILS
jgi:hypothetical protein